MSWSRFGSSDVYTFPSAHGAECCGCWLGEPKANGWGASFVSLDLAEFIAHIGEHRAAGHDVPPLLEDDIRDEWAEFFGVPSGGAS